MHNHSTHTIVIISSCLALFACSSNTPLEPTAIPDIPTPSPPTYTVQRGLVIRGIEFSGRVQPKESQSLAFNQDGRVFKINFQLNDPVKKGDVIAELDLIDLRAQLEQAQLRLKTSQVTLSATLQSYSDTLRLAQLDLDQAWLRYESARTRAGATNTLQQNELARNAKKIDDIKKSIQDARANFNQAGADNAQKLLEEAEIERERLLDTLSGAQRESRVRELDVAMLRNDVERAEINVRSLKSKIDPQLNQAIESAKLEVETLQKKIDSSSLVAPFDGVIATTYLTVGDNIRALDQVVVVAKPGDLEIVAPLSESQQSEVSQGQEVSVVLSNARERTFGGVVRSAPLFGSNTQRTGSNVARITVDSNAPLEFGTTARVSTVLSKRESTLWLPPGAIRRFRGREFVIVKESDGRERRVDVKIGISGADRVEILDGVKEGEVVIGQ
jgi:HlyD family secretion protein